MGGEFRNLPDVNQAKNGAVHETNQIDVDQKSEQATDQLKMLERMPPPTLTWLLML